MGTADLLYRQLFIQLFGSSSTTIANIISVITCLIDE